MVSARPLSLFGEMLRRYRVAAGLSQEELAERAGLSARAISDLERGVKQTPRKETVALLADALALSPQRRILFGATARPVQSFVIDQASARQVTGDLMTPLTPLVGREVELLAATQALARADVRLLTLTGPGGIGKTRLALRLAEELAGDFADGAITVSLAAIPDAASALPAIARACDLREEPGKPPLQWLIDGLGRRQSLLVLDNLEHMIGVASDLGALLSACPGLKIIVTSRQPLRIRGEYELPVRPLESAAATRLFSDRVRAQGVALDDTPQVEEIVRQICDRLDYLPLALELAAVRARTLPLLTLLHRLYSSLSLLTEGWRDAPERQRTLRATIAWSVDLLDESERQVFRWLAVFQGGATLEAAEQVCAPGGAEADAVLDRIASLVEKNLLMVDESQSEPRFSMLRTIWEYADDSLRDAGQEHSASARHADYFARLAEQDDWTDVEARDRLLQREEANMRAALRWATQMRQPALGLRLATGLARYWYMHGHAVEGERWLSDLLALDAQSKTRAAPPLRLAALYAASRFALDRRDVDRAESLAGEGATLAEQQASCADLANMLATQGHIAEARSDTDGALRLFERSLDLSRQANDLPASGRALSSLGNLARAQGDYAHATAYLEESIRVAHTLHLAWGVANGLTSLGHVVCEQGLYQRAAESYRESLTYLGAHANEESIAWTLEGVVALCVVANDFQHAAVLCGAIARLRGAASDGRPWPPYSRAVVKARAALDPASWEGAWSEGSAYSASGAVAAALGALERVAPLLG